MKKKSVIVCLGVLICVLLGVAVLFAVFNQNGLSEENYLSVCRELGFESYTQEVNDESSAGIVKGYISTLLPFGVQMDFYQFESEIFTRSALNRLKDWVIEQHGDGGEEYSSGNRTVWVYTSGTIYCKAVMEEGSLVYIFSSTASNPQEVESIINRVTDS